MLPSAPPWFPAEHAAQDAAQRVVAAAARTAAVHLALADPELVRDVSYGNLGKEFVETGHDMSTFVAGMFVRLSDETSVQRSRNTGSAAADSIQPDGLQRHIGGRKTRQQSVAHCRRGG